MPSFSGVHGTTSSHANNIQQMGFKIDPVEEYHRMFGNGVYMYKNDDTGKQCAREWAKSKVDKEGNGNTLECILFVDFSFNDNEHITWSEEEEIKLLKWLNREMKNVSPEGKLTRQIQNEYRMRLINAAAIHMAEPYSVIFAEMPFPRHLSDHGKKRYAACAVKKREILPDPPYIQE